MSIQIRVFSFITGMNQTGIVPPLRLCFLMWLIFTIEFYTQMDFGHLGIYPLKLTGLVGVFFGPMLHGSFSHIMSNTIPLLVLGSSLYFFFPANAPRVFVYSYFFTGILVWVFGRPFYHIGASGLVYALASFLVFFGFFSRNFKSVIISAITIFFYGGMVYGLFDFNQRVSWESHLMGAVVGFANAYIFSRNKN